MGAVLSVGFSPTGREFVSGGYDRMVRIWNCNTGRSREVYHTKRMGRVFCTNFSQVSLVGVSAHLGACMGTHFDFYSCSNFYTNYISYTSNSDDLRSACVNVLLMYPPYSLDVFRALLRQDGRFVLSGSDDTNLRIWKAQASSNTGKRTAREERSSEYTAALVARHEHMPEVRRISKYRQVPKVIKKTAIRQNDTKESERRKEANRRRHSKPGAAGLQKPERERAVVATVE